MDLGENFQGFGIRENEHSGKFIRLNVWLPRRRAPIEIKHAAVQIIDEIVPIKLSIFSCSVTIIFLKMHIFPKEDA